MSKVGMNLIPCISGHKRRQLTAMTVLCMHVHAVTINSGMQSQYSNFIFPVWAFVDLSKALNHFKTSNKLLRSHK